MNQKAEPAAPTPVRMDCHCDECIGAQPVVPPTPVKTSDDCCKHGEFYGHACRECGGTANEGSWEPIVPPIDATGETKYDPICNCGDPLSKHTGEP